MVMLSLPLLLLAREQPRRNRPAQAAQSPTSWGWRSLFSCKAFGIDARATNIGGMRRRSREASKNRNPLQPGSQQGFSKNELWHPSATRVPNWSRAYGYKGAGNQREAKIPVAHPTHFAAARATDCEQPRDSANRQQHCVDVKLTPVTPPTDQAPTRGQR